jgi:hypothetical protein
MPLPPTLLHMEKTIKHNGLTFEIRLTASDTLVTVVTYLNDRQVSPAYSASLEVGMVYFHHCREHIYKSLLELAEGDIREGIYVGNLSTSQNESLIQTND